MGPRGPQGPPGEGGGGGGGIGTGVAHNTILDPTGYDWDAADFVDYASIPFNPTQTPDVPTFVTISLRVLNVSSEPTTEPGAMNISIYMAPNDFDGTDPTQLIVPYNGLGIPPVTGVVPVAVTLPVSFIVPAGYGYLVVKNIGPGEPAPPAADISWINEQPLGS